MADPRFHYRSDSLTPRRVSVPTTSKAFTTPSGTTPSLLTKTTEVGCIGSTYLDINSNGLGYYRAMRFLGYGNVDSMNSGISVLCRVIPRFTGFNPSSYGGLFTFNGFSNLPYFFLRALTNGAFQATLINADFGTAFNAVSSGTHSFTSGTAVDVVFTWTGTTAANGIKIYINGTLLYQTTASAASNFTDAKGQFFSAIVAGAAWPQGELGGFDLNEMAIWGEVIDPTASGLNLNGSSRTTFVTSTASDALAALPSVGNVLSGTTYGVNSALTGTLALPSTSQVLSGITYGVSGNGSAGILTSADPGQSNVISPISYTINSVARTGSYVPPTYTDISTSLVKIGTNYTANNISKVGLYDGSDRWSVPNQSQVIIGVSYKENSLTNNKAGNVTLPDVDNVRLNISYGANGSANVGNLELPSNSNVRSGVQFGSLGTEYTGTYTPEVIDTGLVVFIEEEKPLMVCLEEENKTDDLLVQIIENDSILVIEEKL